MPKKHVTLELNGSAAKNEEFLLRLNDLLNTYLKDKHTLTQSDFIEEANVTAAKRKYFKMVDELAMHAGYCSTAERKLFKEEVKKELGNESISAMRELEQVSVKIEELYQLAINHYSYKFKVYA